MARPAPAAVDAIVASIMTNECVHAQFSVTEAESLCSGVSPILLGESSLLELPGPINICGDIHGQLPDLMRCFQFTGLPPATRWLFLGDYVDRGPQSVEVLCYLFALKIRYPAHIFLVRGNHETRDMSEVGGLHSECIHKLNVGCWTTFCKVFDAMPLAAVVAHKFFCVHGGIGPKLENLQQIRAIHRPLESPQSGIVMDMLWSDPSAEVADFRPSPRGGTFLWGLSAAERFLAKTGLKVIIRGHQVALNGFDYPFFPLKTVVTVFTASDYSEGSRNKAALIAVDAVGDWEVRIIPSVLVWKQPAKMGSTGKIKRVPGLASVERAPQRKPYVPAAPGQSRARTKSIV
jgi:serine/threonine-protein phosphatase PP1 catalytic subunit